MKAPRQRSEETARAGAGCVLIRALVVVGLAALIALFVLVRPLSELSIATPTPAPADSQAVGTEVSGVSGASSTVGLASSEGEGTAPAPPLSPPSPTVLPTETETPTSTPMDSPTPTREPTASPTATPTSTPTRTPTASPIPLVLTETASPTARQLAGRVDEGSFFSQVTGRQEPYRIYLPPGYDDQDRRYPTLYLLHGWPYDESHWDLLGVDEAADGSIVEGALGPFLIVMPGGDEGGLYVTTSGGPGSYEEQLVNELMPHIDANFRSVQTRDARAIGGISRGGVWSLEIAFRHPDAFGRVGAHSPALSANRAPWTYDPFNLLTGPGVEGLRIYLSAGDADWARQETAELHEALQNAGIASQFILHSGAHVDALWGQHLDEYLAFYAAGW